MSKAVTLQSLVAAQNPLSLQGLFYTNKCESHLDLGSNDGRTLRGLDKATITAVELFTPSVAVLRGEGFKAVYQADIRTLAAAFAQEQQEADAGSAVGPLRHIFDRVTAFDVIEHIPKEDGWRLIDNIEAIAQREILLFLPIETPELEATEKWQQYRETGLSMHPTGQRELHRHLSRWAPSDLADRGYIIVHLPNFHYDGFGAFFAAKYKDPADQAAALERIQAWAATQMGPRIDRPLFINGRQHMDIHPSVSIGFGARLECITEYGGQQYQPKLSIGEGTTAEFFLHIGCAERVSIGKDCIIAGYVSITDHDHGFDPERPLHGQPLTVRPVQIGDHVFLGEHVFIGKGVTIGEHAVIGAHSVVTHDVPAYAVVAGVPARVIRERQPGPAQIEPLVSIVIPTLDVDSERMTRCIQSIVSFTPERHEIIVVNNGNDALVLTDVIKTIVTDKTHVGFARACNMGIAAAKGEYILLLNDDTEVTPGWLGNMLQTMRDVPGAGLVGPMSDHASGPQQGEPSPTPAAWETRRLVAFCLLVKREVVEKIGGLDESFGLNFEDDDYCLRAMAAGYRLLIARHSFVRHIGGVTFKAAGIDYAATLNTAWERFAAKWGAEGGGPATGTYRVEVPPFDPKRHYCPLPT